MNDLDDFIGVCFTEIVPQHSGTGMNDENDYIAIGEAMVAGLERIRGVIVVFP